MNKTEKIISIVCIIILVAIFGALFGAYGARQNLYSKSGYVVYVDPQVDIILIDDYSGERWIFQGVEDWMEGDLCSMIMDGHGTPDIKDDDIISIRYEGYKKE